MRAAAAAAIDPAQTAAAAAATAAAAAAAALDLQGLGESCDTQEVRAFLRQRFGNHSGEVLNVLRFWEAYGKLFDVWMAPWTADDDAYRAKRACQFARAAADLAAKLLAVSNYKHKSWYVHMICFVVPQQIFKYGNVWRFSTAGIESRGSRLKRLGRTTVCWRKAVHGWTSYDYTVRSTGAKRQRMQGYSSSAVQQLLVKVCAQEESWHSSDNFATPAKIRLQQQLRTCRLKCEMVEVTDRQSAGSILTGAAASHATPAPSPAAKPTKVWEPKPLACVGGLPVFGPHALPGGVFKGV